MADGAVVAKGKQVYEYRCQHCHGAGVDGQGSSIEFLKVQPADLSNLCGNDGTGCVTDYVLKAVLGKHEIGDKKMPLLKNYLSVDEVYFLSEFIKTQQR